MHTKLPYIHCRIYLFIIASKLLSLCKGCCEICTLLLGHTGLVIIFCTSLCLKTNVQWQNNQMVYICNYMPTYLYNYRGYKFPYAFSYGEVA